MKIVKTVKYKITSHNSIFEDTLSVYRNSVQYIVKVVNDEWDILESKTSKERLTLVEKLIHKTKKNPYPKYDDFDYKFHKFPSYFRRSAINEATGIVSSYRSNLINWKEEKEVAVEEEQNFTKKPPRLGHNHYSFPVFYKKNMFNKLDDNSALIKIFQNNDWIWIKIDYKGSNNLDLDLYKEQNPTLVRNGKKYYLHIPYEAKVGLKTTKLKDRVVVSVDLGITNSAVCSAIKSDGTVIGRVFINQPIEKDRMNAAVGRLSKINKLSGIGRKPNYWRRTNNYQTQIVQDTVNQIIKFAEKYQADVIVFEYLSKMKVPKGFYGAKKLSYKLQFWAKRKIQNKTIEKAHSLGIRASFINPRNTSKLAFDGTGEVKRNAKKDLCTFTTRKTYHADLNASYNIGARYFIREYLKTLSEKKELLIQAKVPELATRTKCTLASLISLHKEVAQTE